MESIARPVHPKVRICKPNVQIRTYGHILHIFKAYPKEDDLAQAPEPGVFLCNKKTGHETREILRHI